MRGVVGLTGAGVFLLSIGACGARSSGVTILPCDGVTPEGGWQRITPPGDLGDTQAIALDPFAVGTLYVQMHKGGNGNHSPTDGLYKSTDCGATWNKLPAGRNASDTPGADGKPGVNIHAGSIVSLIVDVAEPGVMYTASNYGPPGIYKSSNGGVDWDQLIPDDLKVYLPYGGWFNALSVDPTDHLHLIGSTHTGCMGQYTPNCLAETRDGGATWRLVPAPESGNEQCGPYIHDSTTLIYASGQSGAYLTTNDEPSSDAAPTWNQINQGANGADTGLQAYRATSGKYYIASDYGVLVGSPDFRTWTLDTESPRPLTFIVGTGQTLFAASRSEKYFTADEAAPTTGTELTAGGTPPTVAGRWLVYDDSHHLLYSSSWGDGLYRLATP